jgi:hypothetical protein
MIVIGTTEQIPVCERVESRRNNGGFYIVRCD